jgi:hypothetical protein
VKLRLASTNTSLVCMYARTTNTCGPGRRFVYCTHLGLKHEAHGRLSRRQSTFCVLANVNLKSALVPVTTPLGPDVIATVGLAGFHVPGTKNPGDVE